MRYVIKRFGQSVLTVFAVITIAFVLIRLMPGGPVDALVARLIEQGYGTEAINAMVESFIQVNPNQPLLPAYLDYMSSILQGQFGTSIGENRPVLEILVQALPWTLFYASISLLISFTCGVLLGALMAYREGSRFDLASTVAAIMINSTPFYIFGVIALAIFGYQLGWFPTGGRMVEGTFPGLNAPFVLGLLHHAALPILSSAVLGFGGFALGMRSNSISVLGEDYLRVGRLRGLSENRIAFRYVGRNAILPLYTRLMLSLGAVVGGSVILEKVFRYPGIGYFMFQAVKGRDLPLMMGGFIIISLAIISGVFVADLTYSRIDPRAGNRSSASGTKTKLFSRTTLRRFGYGLRGSASKLRESVTRRDSDRDDETETATGSTASPLQTVREGNSPSRTERLFRAYDEFVRAPAKVIWSDWRTRIGVSILLFYILMGTVGMLIVDPTHLQEGPSLLPPFHEGWISVSETTVFGLSLPVLVDFTHPLGTDANGQDLLSLVVRSTPAMLKMILAGAVFSTTLATVVGTLSGYFKGSALDRILTTISDVAMTIPGLPLIMVLSVTLEPENPYMVGFLLTITTWAGLSRTLRSEVLKIREEEYIEASQMMGISTSKVLLTDVIPNMMPYILVSFVNSGRRVIFGSVGLYFLGILPFSNLNWGIILNQAYEYGALISLDLLYWLLIPMVIIMVLSLGMILTAQGMDRLFNPRIRARHESTTESEPEPATTSGAAHSD